MGQEGKVKHRFTGLRIAAIVIVVFLVYYSVMGWIGRSKMLNELSVKYAFRQGKEEPDKSILSDSAFLALLKEKAFLQAGTIMAETDSIYMCVDLRDSVSYLSISGVTVHSAPISFMDVSSVISKGDRSFVYNMLSRPFTIDSSFATIRREPIMVKIAPKDTSEFKPDITPDTSKVEHVNFILTMDNGIRLIVLQEEKDTKGDLVFDLRMRLADAKEAFVSVIKFRVPQYHPYIKIRLRREDARIIYRALPVRGQVAIYT